MEKQDGWKKRFWGMLGAAGLILLGAPGLHAEYTGRGFHAGCEACAKQQAASDSRRRKARSASLEKLRQDWDEIGEVVVRSMLEASLTMFWIRVPTPPTTGPSDPGGSGGTPGKQTGGPSPTGPGDPTGQGDPGGNPTTVSDPNVAPEPSSLICALVGAGFVSLAALRRRRRKSRLIPVTPQRGI